MTLSQHFFFLPSCITPYIPTSTPPLYTFSLSKTLQLTISISSPKVMFLQQNLLCSSFDDDEEDAKKAKTTKAKAKEGVFSINDHPDILVEVLKRLDGRSLGVASCVCRLWHSISTSDDSVWEYVCFRHVSPSLPPSVRPLVSALGGYKRLYMVCVRPVLYRLDRTHGPKRTKLTRRVWTRHGAQLLLSLFCVDYYENLGGGINTSTSTSTSGGVTIGSDAASSSLMFLCKPVNV